MRKLVKEENPTCTYQKVASFIVRESLFHRLHYKINELHHERNEVTNSLLHMHPLEDHHLLNNITPCSEFIILN